MTAHFFVPGSPLPKGSKAHVGHGRLVEQADRKTTRRPAGALSRWQDAVRSVAAFHLRGPRPAIESLAVRVRLVFRLPRPASVRRCDPTARGTGDLDKLARAVLDGLEGVAYRDDAQVCELELRKEYDLGQGDGTGVYVTVMAA